MNGTAPGRQELPGRRQSRWVRRKNSGEGRRFPARPRPSALGTELASHLLSTDRVPAMNPSFRHLACAILLALAGSVAGTAEVDAASRVKDIVDFEGIRENMLVGYGLVVGLNGTGDSLNK